MPWLVRVLIVLAIGVPLVAAMPGRSVACECARLDAHRIVRQADAIVAGHVTVVVPIDPMHTMSTLAVDGLYRGRVGRTVTLSAPIGPGGGSDCAVLYPVGSKIDPLVLIGQPDGTFQVDTCALPLSHQIGTLLGTARPPLASGPPPAPIPTTVAPPPTGAAPVPADGVSWPAVGWGGVIAVVLIVLAILRSGRGGEPSPADDAQDAAAVSDGASPTAPSD
jgi:hypothetical protein